jgi:4'-phosphopantetheinyl transferase
MTALSVPSVSAVDCWPSEQPATDVGSSCAVDVWFADLDRPHLPLDNLVAILDATERRRAAAFVFPDDERRFVAARGLLRLLLAAYTSTEPAALRLYTGPDGKPELTTLPGKVPLRFNHSRSGRSALYVISHAGRVGVDLEVCRPLPEALAIAQQWFTPDERARLATLKGRQRTEAFLHLWVSKEAYGKARGDGLTDDLRHVELGAVPPSPTSCPIGPGAPGVDDSVPAQWTLHSLPGLTGIAAALVVEGDRVEPRCRSLDLDPQGMREGRADDVRVRFTSSLAR